jgi:ABC-type nitrate/sulfonate/bicarbonate transport system substrate-binding protein
MPTSIRTSVFSRRSATSVLGALAAVALLAGCAAASSGSGPAKTDATLQLGWIANVENMGPYVADNSGYYSKQGLNLTITPGGPSTTVEPLVASGKALVGLSSVDIVAKAVLAGAPLKIVAATLQVNPTSIMSLASHPITSLKQLVGKRLCIQTSGLEVVNTVLKANGIDPSKVTMVPVQFDPSPLVTGQCDAFTSFLNNQPITLAAQGVKTVTFPLSKYGYHVWADVYVVSDSTLADKTKRDAVVKMIRAGAQGWQKALANPDAAAALMVNKYGKSQNLNLQQQQLGAKSYNALVDTGDAKTQGLLTMSANGIKQNIATLKLLGINISAKKLFDTSLVGDAYDGKTSIK